MKNPLFLICEFLSGFIPTYFSCIRNIRNIRNIHTSIFYSGIETSYKKVRLRKELLWFMQKRLMSRNNDEKIQEKDFLLGRLL